MEMKTRTTVLSFALEAEHQIQQLVLTYLKVSSEKRKAFTNKSGGFSFKNKIDLLYDIEVLSKDEHDKYLLLMEFRNQFMHNYECDTFTDAVSILGSEKKNKLTKFLDNQSNAVFTEDNYLIAFNNLSLELLSTTLQKLSQRDGIIKENTHFIQILVKSYLDTTNRYIELANTIMNYKGVNAHPYIIEMQKILGNHSNEDNSSFLTLKYFQHDKWDTIVARLIDAV